ncbi:MAG: Transcriptional regulatory protein [Myxococcaceae bacterium]|nr:Transcriptional regulatory protein [Myxococcaceae bacterium]
MVVEDDDDIRELVAELLRDEGYDVREAENGQRALEQLDSMDKEPCLVLLDLMMPVMSGPQLLRILEQSHRLASLPVVVLSAGGRPEDAPASERIHAEAHIRRAASQTRPRVLSSTPRARGLGVASSDACSPARLTTVSSTLQARMSTSSASSDSIGF